MSQKRESRSLARTLKTGILSAERYRNRPPGTFMVTFKSLVACSSVLFVGLSSCAIQRAEMASRTQKELVGMSKKNLLSCAGVPSRQERVEELEFLTFTGGDDTVGTGTANSVSPNIMFGVYRAPQRSCEATFVLKDGIVEKVNYQGGTGGSLTKGERCAFIVENCLKP
jgi:hypothetical protein